MKTFKIQSEVSEKEVKSLLISIYNSDMSVSWARTEASEKEFIAIMEGKEIQIKDIETEEEYILTLNKIIKGIGLFLRYNNYYHIPLEELGCADSVQADMILQYALFGKLIYG